MTAKSKSGVPLALVSVAIWSTTSTVAKLLLNSLPDFQVLAVGSAFAFVGMLAVLFATGSHKKLKRFRPVQYLLMAGLGFLGLFLYSALYYRGLGYLTAGEACLLNYLWPILLVLFSCLILKEKMTFIKALALGLSFAGVVVLSLGGAAQQGSRLPGILMCVAAAACYGLYCVLNKRSGFDQTVLLTVVWFTVTVCAVAAGLVTEKWTPLSGMQWLGLGWIGLGVNAAAYLTWGLALQRASSTALVSNLAYIVPPASLLLSAAVLNETITPAVVAALVLIVGGVLLQSLAGRKHVEP